MVNPMAMMQIMGMYDKFKKNHPKVPQFFVAASRMVSEDSIIEMSVTSRDGEKITTNMKVTRDDIELIEQLKAMGNNK